MLRPTRDIKECIFPGDDDELTFHLGAFEEGKLVSVAAFFFINNSHFTEPNQYRLRGMATLPEYQRRGLSKSLLQTAFPILMRNQCALLWCHAREVAIPFYQTMQFKSVGDFFMVEGLPETGRHLLMYKQL